jgi:DNA-binding transcriptional ArsR family regulator
MDRAANVSIVAIGRAVSEPSRVAMLLALFDRASVSVSELAKTAGIAASTASAHIDQLEQVGLVVRERVGRTTKVRFANGEAASMVEQLLTFNPPESPDSFGKFEPTTKIGRLRIARTCYDHLAGELGVGLADRLVAVDVLQPDLQPTTRADEWFRVELGIDMVSVRSMSPNRPFVRSCLDWTERRPHVAGRLGTALFLAFRDRGWVRQNPNDRSLRITESGQGAINRFFTDR